MCGLAAVLGAQPDEACRLQALEALHHRGPDGRGTFEDDGLWLGHTRLAIIDLSHAADQPMVSPDGRYVLAYNGEIYNYVELRETIGDAWPWQGHGDTETLLALLALRGESCLPDLRGMFAFVLWDRQRRRLLAARDHFGIKPLYYGAVGGPTVVASELGAIRALVGPVPVEPAAVESFLLTGSVQGPQTILAGIRSLPPGHLVEIEGGAAHERSFAALPGEPGPARPEADVVAELDELLAESVRVELRADVPVGVFLSGGLDSSLITAYASQELGDDLRTFSVGFEGVDPRWDESSLAALVSRRFRTRHERVVVHRSDFETQMDAVVAAVDQPSVDGVNSYFVAGAAARAVKVALSGQGGDELFAGYNVFQFASRVAGISGRLPQVPPSVARIAPAFLRLPARVQHNWYLRAAATVLSGADAAFLDAITNPLFGPREIGAAPRAPAPRRDGDLVNELSLLKIRGYLANTLLRDMDAMSMAHSLEVRVPYVDRVLADFALSLPGGQKVAWGAAKAPLRALARRRLPLELLSHPKQGFNFPLAEWLRAPSCRARLHAALDPDRVREAGLVEPRLVRRELARLERPRPGDLGWLRAQRVWALFVLHEWDRLWRAGPVLSSGIAA